MLRHYKEKEEIRYSESGRKFLSGGDLGGLFVRFFLPVRSEDDEGC